MKINLISVFNRNKNKETSITPANMSNPITASGGYKLDTLKGDTVSFSGWHTDLAEEKKKIAKRDAEVRFILNKHKTNNSAYDNLTSDPISYVQEDNFNVSKYDCDMKLIYPFYELSPKLKGEKTLDEKEYLDHCNNNFITCYKWNSPMAKSVFQYKPIENGKMYLNMFAINPKYKETKEAVFLIDEMFTGIKHIADLNDAKSISIHINTNDKSALKLAQKFGFDIKEEVKNHYQNGDAYLLEYDVEKNNNKNIQKARKQLLNYLNTQNLEAGQISEIMNNTQPGNEATAKNLVDIWVNKTLGKHYTLDVVNNVLSHTKGGFGKIANNLIWFDDNYLDGYKGLYEALGNANETNKSYIHKWVNDETIQRSDDYALFNLLKSAKKIDIKTLDKLVNITPTGDYNDYLINVLKAVQNDDFKKDFLYELLANNKGIYIFGIADYVEKVNPDNINLIRKLIKKDEEDYVGSNCAILDAAKDGHGNFAMKLIDVPEITNGQIVDILSSTETYNQELAEKLWNKEGLSYSLIPKILKNTKEGVSDFAYKLVDDDKLMENELLDMLKSIKKSDVELAGELLTDEDFEIYKKTAILEATKENSLEFAREVLKRFKVPKESLLKISETHGGDPVEYDMIADLYMENFQNIIKILSATKNCHQDLALELLDRGDIELKNILRILWNAKNDKEEPEAETNNEFGVVYNAFHLKSDEDRIVMHLNNEDQNKLIEMETKKVVEKPSLLVSKEEQEKQSEFIRELLNNPKLERKCIGDIIKKYKQGQEQFVRDLINNDIIESTDIPHIVEGVRLGQEELFFKVLNNFRKNDNKLSAKSKALNVISNTIPEANELVDKLIDIDNYPSKKYDYSHFLFYENLMKALVFANANNIKTVKYLILNDFGERYYSVETCLDRIAKHVQEGQDDLCVELLKSPPMDDAIIRTILKNAKPHQHDMVKSLKNSNLTSYAYDAILKNTQKGCESILPMLYKKPKSQDISILSILELINCDNLEFTKSLLNEVGDTWNSQNFYMFKSILEKAKPSDSANLIKFINTKKFELKDIIKVIDKNLIFDIEEYPHIDLDVVKNYFEVIDEKQSEIFLNYLKANKDKNFAPVELVKNKMIEEDREGLSEGFGVEADIKETFSNDFVNIVNLIDLIGEDNLNNLGKMKQLKDFQTVVNLAGQLTINLSQAEYKIFQMYLKNNSNLSFAEKINRIKTVALISKKDENTELMTLFKKREIEPNMAEKINRIFRQNKPYVEKIEDFITQFDIHDLCKNEVGAELNELKLNDGMVEYFPEFENKNEPSLFVFDKPVLKINDEKLKKVIGLLSHDNWNEKINTIIIKNIDNNNFEEIFLDLKHSGDLIKYQHAALELMNNSQISNADIPYLLKRRTPERLDTLLELLKHDSFVKGDYRSILNATSHKDELSILKILSNVQKENKTIGTSDLQKLLKLNLINDVDNLNYTQISKILENFEKTRKNQDKILIQYVKDVNQGKTDEYNELRQSAIEKRNLLKTHVEDVKDSDINKFFDENFLKIINSLDLLGESTLTYAFTLKLKGLDQLVDNIETLTEELEPEMYEDLKQRLKNNNISPKDKIQMAETLSFLSEKYSNDKLGEFIKEIKSNKLSEKHVEMVQEMFDSEKTLNNKIDNFMETFEVAKEKRQLVESCFKKPPVKTQIENIDKKIEELKEIDLSDVVKKEKLIKEIERKIERLSSSDKVSEYQKEQILSNLKNQLKSITDSNSNYHEKVQNQIVMLMALKQKMIKNPELYLKPEITKNALNKLMNSILIEAIREQNNIQWNRILNKEIFKMLNISYDDKISKHLDFGGCKYIPELLRAPESFTNEFEHLVGMIYDDSDKSMDEIFDALPANQKTKELFKTLNVDYDSWAHHDKSSYLSVEVQAGADNLKQNVIKNFEADFNDNAFKILPKSETNKIFEKLKEINVEFKEVKETIFDANGFTNDYRIVGRFFYKDKPISFTRLRKVISLVKKEMNSNEYWTKEGENKELNSAKETFYSHIMKLRDAEIKNVSQIKEDESSMLKIQKVDMNNLANSLFLGNHASCCTAVAGSFSYQKSAPRYVWNKCIGAIEVVDGRNSVGNTMCYIAKINGVASLVLDNIELNQKYQYNNKIRDAIFEYAEKLIEEIGNPDMPIYAGPYRHKLDMEHLPKAKELFEIVGKTDRAVYIDAFTELCNIPEDTNKKIDLYRIK